MELSLDEFTIRFLSDIYHKCKSEFHGITEDELIKMVEDRINLSYKIYRGLNE